MHKVQLNSCSQTLPTAKGEESYWQFQCEFPGCCKLWQNPFPKGTKASAAEWGSRSDFPLSSLPCLGQSPATLHAGVHIQLHWIQGLYKMGKATAYEV